MTTKQDTIVVTARVEMSASALQAIVANAKNLVGRNVKGGFRMDTATIVDQMISLFLLENDFETFAGDLANLIRSSEPGRDQ